MNKSKYNNSIEAIASSQTILLMAHVNPDGDSLGCMLALRIALERIGKKVTMISPDGVADMYTFLPGSGDVLRSLSPDNMFDLGIVIDCDSLERLGPALPYLNQCRRVMEIDHHPGVVRCDGANIIDSKAAATGEIVYELLLALGTQITPDIAECLLTAIATDTGSFRFSNVRPKTLRIAGDLVEAGASIAHIGDRVFDTRSLASLKLLGIALENLTVTADGKIAYSYLSRQDMQRAGAQDWETEGIVNYTRAVQGVCIGILLTETQSGHVKISFRARGEYDVSKLARMLGGGGHKAASGATLDMPLNESINIVLETAKQWMESLM